MPDQLASGTPGISPASLHLTVAICTWNRADLLRATLGQMRHLVIPRDTSWELVVVNNNCTDDTDSVLEEFRHHLPLRRVFEPKPGLSNARNAAVIVASGDFILWTDDDVLVDPQWLAAYSDAIRGDPDADILGGEIQPWFEGGAPRWLSHGLKVVEDAYAARHCAEREISIEKLPFGANMAVRRAIQVRHKYDPALGRAPGQSLLGEEAAVLGAILKAGSKGYWVPDAKVTHFVPRSRQSIGYLWRYWRGNGLSTARVAPCPPGRLRLLGSPGWLWREATTAALKLVLSLIASPPARWLTHMRDAALCWGRLEGAWRRQ